jgi:hypothetical protein
VENPLKLWRRLVGGVAQALAEYKKRKKETYVHEVGNGS